MKERQDLTENLRFMIPLDIQSLSCVERTKALLQFAQQFITHGNQLPPNRLMLLEASFRKHHASTDDKIAAGGCGNRYLGPRGQRGCKYILAEPTDAGLESVPHRRNNRGISKVAQGDLGRG